MGSTPHDPWGSGTILYSRVFLSYRIITLMRMTFNGLTDLPVCKLRRYMYTMYTGLVRFKV